MSEHTPTPWNVVRGMVRAAVPQTILAGNYTIATSMIPVAECIVRDGDTIINPDWEANAEYIVRACNAHEELVQALNQIATLEPKPFPSFPHDWSEQIAACAECQRWKGHPIQAGICDEHRRPLWRREQWDKDEILRLGSRAREIAREAIAKAEGK